MGKKYILAVPASPSWPRGVEAPCYPDGRVIPNDRVKDLVEMPYEDARDFLGEAELIGLAVDIQALDWRAELLTKHYSSEFGNNPIRLRSNWGDDKIIAVFNRKKREARAFV
ncbi:MAG: hypothetical protein KJ718_06285 [Nanoarchaeota archaeon]|nr:hypothetical protein [Nanoarchaeota archaeon]MBU1052127.1 hypothetical protein [Nanoarchaeota archaeon]MBU1988047.1 hypothetical protein [Nanoarchaeota archaeon]